MPRRRGRCRGAGLLAGDIVDRLPHTVASATELTAATDGGDVTDRGVGRGRRSISTRSPTTSGVLRDAVGAVGGVGGRQGRRVRPRRGRRSRAPRWRPAPRGSVSRSWPRESNCARPASTRRSSCCRNSPPTRRRPSSSTGSRRPCTPAGIVDALVGGRARPPARPSEDRHRHAARRGPPAHAWRRSSPRSRNGPGGGAGRRVHPSRRGRRAGRPVHGDATGALRRRAQPRAAGLAVHVANSAGALAHPAARRSFVRAGIALYGDLTGPRRRPARRHCGR